MSDIKKLRRELGNQIQTARLANRLSQSGLAAKVGMDRQTIYRIENALTGTTKESAIKIAEVLRLDVNHVLALVAGMENAPAKPETVEDLVQTLSDMGFDIQFEGDLKAFTDNDLQEIIDDINAKLLVKGQRYARERGAGTESVRVERK